MTESDRKTIEDLKLEYRSRDLVYTYLGAVDTRSATHIVHLWGDTGSSEAPVPSRTRDGMWIVVPRNSTAAAAPYKEWAELTFDTLAEAIAWCKFTAAAHNFV